MQQQYRCQNLKCVVVWVCSTSDEELCDETVKEVVKLVVSPPCQSTHQHLLVWVASQRHLKLYHSSKPEAVSRVRDQSHVNQEEVSICCLICLVCLST